MRKHVISYPFLKVGRLKKSIADKAHIKSADIYVTEDHLRHIYNYHGKELSTMGFSAMDFVKTIVSNFNQIRIGSGNSYLLVIYDEKSSVQHTAAISINYIVKKGIWEVKTAQPRSVQSIKKKKRIW